MGVLLPRSFLCARGIFGLDWFMSFVFDYFRRSMHQSPLRLAGVVALSEIVRV